MQNQRSQGRSCGLSAATPTQISLRFNTADVAKGKKPGSQIGIPQCGLLDRSQTWPNPARIKATSLMVIRRYTEHRRPGWRNAWSGHGQWRPRKPRPQVTGRRADSVRSDPGNNGRPSTCTPAGIGRVSVHQTCCRSLARAQNGGPKSGSPSLRRGEILRGRAASAHIRWRRIPGSLKGRRSECQRR